MVNPVRKLITYNNITNHVRNSYTRLSQILLVSNFTTDYTPAAGLMNP